MTVLSPNACGWLVIDMTEDLYEEDEEDDDEEEEDVLYATPVFVLLLFLSPIYHFFSPFLLCVL